MIIAVDGPTASGKGTIAKALAAHFSLPHLDTGLLYRAVGRQVFLDGGDPGDPGDALAATTFPDWWTATKSLFSPSGSRTSVTLPSDASDAPANRPCSLAPAPATSGSMAA
jgi:cytidylate kinase